LLCVSETDALLGALDAALEVQPVSTVRRVKGWHDVTVADLRRMGKGPATMPQARRSPVKASLRPMKYRNTRVTADGEVFDSKHELKVWRDLQARQAAGEISGLLHHPCPIELLCPVVHDAGTMRGVVGEYRPDFAYYEQGREVIADAKSPATRKNAVYRLKAHWLRLQENIAIVEL
jgi:hypothetical protein